MKAQTHRAPIRRRRIVRACKTGTATEAIGTLTPGCEIFTLTYGQFSLIDALCAILEQTGPAHVTVATWSAAEADLRRAERLLSTAKISSMRYIVDRSFATRQPEYCQAMRTLFGDDCIRTARAHSKWATITNDRWTLAIRTSMNLNHNPRLENIEISDDPELHDFLKTAADDLFTEQQPGSFNAELPKMESLEDTRPEPKTLPEILSAIDSSDEKMLLRGLADDKVKP